MEIKRAKVIGYESINSHKFIIGEIVTYIGRLEEDEEWFTFVNKDGIRQELTECEFEWL